MAAWLVLLRSRLLLPANDPEAWAAREEAEALDHLPQLGHDVFARHSSVPPVGTAPVERTADLTALLCVCAHLLGSPLPSAGRWCSEPKAGRSHPDLVTATVR